MQDSSHVLSILVLLAACLFAATLMLRLRQPTLIGYIAGGILIGPHGFGVVPYEKVSLLAELGVSFLLFTIGVELSIRKLTRVGAISVFGSALMLALTAAITMPLAGSFGLTKLAAFTIACALWMSSTAVVLRLIADRAEVGSMHGNIATGVLVFQDIAAVPILAVIPTIAAREVIDPAFLGQLGLKILAFVILLFGAARFLVPRILMAIARTRSKELFSIAVLCICAGVAAISHELGLSLALGAFVAGLIISESDFGNQAISDILPFKDSFGAVFFASVGMLLNPRVFAEQFLWVVAGLAALIAGKFLVSFAVIYLFRYPVKTNVFASLSLAQIGEFSLLLLIVALGQNIIPERAYHYVLALAVISIVITPYLLHAGPRLARFLNFLDRTAWLANRAERDGPLQPQAASAGASPRALSDHIILCGFGPTGSIVREHLCSAGLRVVVIDLNYKVVQDLKRDGHDAVYGDSSNMHVLEKAGLKNATLLIVTIPDPIAMRTIVSRVRAAYPQLPIYVRVKYNSDRQKLLNLGATDIVWEEFEAGQELAMRTLRALRL